ncbi:Ig-like domain-containing protein [bacterium]|nr:Ig-like domain-containing protein [bacterium]
MVYLELKAEDPDGDILTFSVAASLPQGAKIVQSPPSLAVLLWEPAPHQVGSHKIVFTVSDGKGGRDTLPLEVEVAPAVTPQAP